MSNIKKVLDQLSEKVKGNEPKKDDVTHYQVANKVSWQEAYDILYAKLNPKVDKERKPREKKEPTPKEPTYTDAQYKKMCKGAREDWEGDNAHDKENGDELDMDIGDVAYDMADSMLYDPKLLAYVKKKLGSSYSKQTAREYVADDIVG